MKNPVLFVSSNEKEVNGTKYIYKFAYIKESLVYSIIEDLFTYGILMAGICINHFYIGSTLLHFVFLICYFVLIRNISKTKLTNKEDFLKGFNEAMEGDNEQNK